MVVECISVSIAMYCLIQFYVQVKDDISQYRPFLKIMAIKLVIFLSFWQTVCLFSPTLRLVSLTWRLDSYFLPCIFQSDQTVQKGGND